MQVPKRPFPFTLLWLALLAAPTLQAQTVAIEAFADPPTVMVGESAQYTVRLHNAGGVPNMVAPRVDGLEFSGSASTSSSTQIINGRRSSFTELSWTFRGLREGEFTIPGRTVRIANENLVIPPVAVRVVPQSEEARSRARLLLEIPERSFYVGEAIPATLHLLVRRDLNLAGAEFPQTDEASVQHTPFSNSPRRGSVRYQGILYQTLTWDFHLTPVRNGSFNLQFAQNIVLQTTDPDTRNYGFFNFGRTRNEQLTVVNDAVTLNVLPLPTEGRPESFAGAVGDFRVEAHWSTSALTVGDPVTLTLRLSGTGNFDRIGAPELPAWGNWRIYPPRVEFESPGQSPIEGTKSFEYILLPESLDITELPAFSYSTFDPASGRYVTHFFAAQPITIAPAKDAGGETAFFNHSSGDAARAPGSILPLRPEPGKLHSPRTNVWQSPLFWGVQGGIGALFLAAFLAESRNSRRHNDQRWQIADQQQRHLRQLLRKAALAARSGDALAVHIAARQILQILISQSADTLVEPGSLATADCIALLQRCNLGDDSCAEAIRLLETADALQFAGIPAAGVSAESAFQQLQRLTNEFSSAKANR